MKRADGSEVCIGDRIECDGYQGTLKFFGAIESINGVWLGVDWDDISRGKHDGSYKSKRYFQANHPKSGSFIIPKKASYGISFPEAYSCKIKEVINMHHRILILNNRAIYDLVPDKLDIQLTEALLKITDLDLSGNLLKNWNQVAEIAGLIPNLSRLNVSHNRLILPEVTESLISSFMKVEELIINWMGYDWTAILACSSMFPNVRSLFVCFNNLEKLVDSTGHLQKLELLSIANNQICDWKEILKLGHLPQLNTLFINNNELTSVIFDDVSLLDGKKTSYFPNLQKIDLNTNAIKDLSAIDELGKLPNLKDISSLHNPMEKEYKDKLYLMIIGKLGKLEINAKTSISIADRKNAEIYYLHTVARIGLENKLTEEDLVKQYSRYKELVEKYGLPHASALQQGSTVLRDKLIPVDIRSPNIPDKIFKNKKLSPTMTILKLKSLVQRLFRIKDIRGLKLSYVSKKNPDLEVEMDGDLYELSFYSIEKGDSLVVKW